jgi:hypothetical protein
VAGIDDIGNTEHRYTAAISIYHAAVVPRERGYRVTLREQHTTAADLRLMSRSPTRARSSSCSGRCCGPAWERVYVSETGHAARVAGAIATHLTLSDPSCAFC